MNERFFTLEEARYLLPELRKLLQDANKELDEHARLLEEANQVYLKAEMELDDSQAPEHEDNRSLTKFRQQRAKFESAIDNLSRVQNEYLRILETWVDKISGYGVILRKIREGLVDFPAKEGKFRYFLCWQFNESDISHWHEVEDGFAGRRKLSTLLEYCMIEAES